MCQRLHKNPLTLRRCSCAGFKHTKQTREKEGPVTCDNQPPAEPPSFGPYVGVEHTKRIIASYLLLPTTTSFIHRPASIAINAALLQQPRDSTFEICNSPIPALAPTPRPQQDPQSWPSNHSIPPAPAALSTGHCATRLADQSLHQLSTPGCLPTRHGYLSISHAVLPRPLRLPGPFLLLPIHHIPHEPCRHLDHLRCGRRRRYRPDSSRPHISTLSNHPNNGRCIRGQAATNDERQPPL